MKPQTRWEKFLDLAVRPKYWWYRRKHGYPCAAEVWKCLCKIPGGRLSLTIQGIGIHYCNSVSLENTADDFNVPRERVRQVLWKIYRQAQ